MRTARGSGRSGLTLFEVLLSLAILAASLAAIGQLISNGVRGAVKSHLKTEAIIRCQSQMAELMAMSEPMPNVSEQPFADDPKWTWSVTSSETDAEGLASLVVTVSHAAENGVGRVSYSLSRLYRDPSLSPVSSSVVTDLEEQE